jgi:hypothetical protein
MWSRAHRTQGKMRHLFFRYVPASNDEALSCMSVSSGVNSESSFEADLLTIAPGCRVFGYDSNADGVHFPFKSYCSLLIRPH